MGPHRDAVGNYSQGVLSMRRSTITTTATLGAVLTIGSIALAGTAGAAPSGHSRADRLHAIATSGKLPANFTCAHANQDLTRIVTAQDVLLSRITRGNAALQRAQAAGDTAKATSITDRLTRANQATSDLATVSHLISSACPGSIADASSASSAAAKMGTFHQAAARIERVAHAGVLPTTFTCTSAASDQAKISGLVSTIDAKLATLHGRQQSATDGGNSARAARIEAKITKATTLKQDAAKVAALISADCGS